MNDHGANMAREPEAFWRVIQALIDFGAVWLNETDARDLVARLPKGTDVERYRWIESEVERWAVERGMWKQYDRTGYVWMKGDEEAERGEWTTVY